MYNGPNRPVRRRKSVSHYTDDNPNTFTVKPKRGDPVVVTTSASPRKSTVTDHSVETGGAANKQSRQRRRDSTPITALKPPPQPPPSTVSTSSSSPRSFAALAVKSKSKSWKQLSEPSRVTKDSDDSKPAYRVGSFPRKRKAPTEAVNGGSAPDPVVTVAPDTILPHCFALQPILPLRVLSPSHYSTLSGGHASGTNGNKLVPPCASQIPILRDSHVALNTAFKNHGRTSWKALVPTVSGPPSAAKHSITWWSLRSDNANYAAAGDCLGRVLLYRLDTHSTSTSTHANRRPLKILTTSAAIRERHRVWTSKKVISYPNAIIQCAWCQSLVVVLTDSEVELLQLVPSAEGAVRVGRVAVHLPKVERKILVSQAPCLQIHGQGERYQILWTTWHREMRRDAADDTADRCDENTTLRTNNSVFHWDVTFEHTKSNDSPGDEMETTTVTETRDTTDAAANDDSVFRKPSVTPLDVFLSAPTLAAVTLTKLDVRDESSEKQIFVCWTTLWESGKWRTDQQTFLMIAQTGPNTMELLRGRRIPVSTATANSVLDHSSMGYDGLQVGSIDIITRQTLPNLKSGGNQTATNTNGNAPASDDMIPISDCCLQQFQQYVFVTGALTKGIRMHRTDSLEAVATFGETVQLHGKLVQWNRCAWVRVEPIPPSELRIEASTTSTSSGTTGTGADTTGMTAAGSSSGGNKKKQSWWVERPDELATRDRQARRALAMNDATEANTNEDDFWLVGFPHPFKGPDELKTTLYLWKLCGATGLQSTASATLQGPISGCTSDAYVASGCTRMICLGAETGQLYEWGPTVRSDFAGVMYPVGYKVISDNVEYVEDEDELDQVMMSDREAGNELEDTAIMMELKEGKVDHDLAEALRLSLLDHGAQHKSEVNTTDVPISVLRDNAGDDGDEFMVPCWPERRENDSDDDTCTTLSPQRCRSFSSAGIQDDANAFELSFLTALPQTSAVRSEVHAASRKRFQQQETNEIYTANEKPKVKGKRTRTATVEVLLQSSVDPELRASVGKVRGKWTKGRGSVLTSEGQPETSHSLTHTALELKYKAPERANENGDKDLLVLVQPASAEEKSLAMELLHLSPSHCKKVLPSNLFEEHAPGNAETAVNGTMSELQTSGVTLLSDGLSADALVTPSEPSPVHDSASNPTDQRFAAVDPPYRDDVSFAQGECMACLGRMVLHRCGLRSKPVDYEALARADEEQKQREADEKHRLRAERRRIAEARRRQSRRDKKMEEERKHIEELERNRAAKKSRQNRKDVYEHGHHGYASLPHTNANLYSHSELPHGGTMYQHHHTRPYSHSEQFGPGQYAPDAPVGNVGYGHVPNGAIGYTGVWGGPRDSTSMFHRETVNLNGTEVTPSTSIDPMDALAALAGIADSISQPSTTNNASEYAPEESRRLLGWNEPPTTTERSRSFEHNGSGRQDSLMPGVGVQAQPVLQHEQVPATTAETALPNERHTNTFPAEVQGTTLAHIDYRDQTAVEVDKSDIPPSPMGPEKPVPTIPSHVVATAQPGTDEPALSPNGHATDRAGDSTETNPRPTRTLMPHEEFQAHALLALAQSASPVQQRSTVMSDMDARSFFPVSAPLTQASELSARHKIMVAGFLQQPSSSLLRSEENDDMLEDGEPEPSAEANEQVSQGEMILDESQNQSIVATGSGCS